jgi:hypothetical protein
MGERPSEIELEEATAEIVPPPPRSWENWQKLLEGLGALQISELRLYTDVDSSQPRRRSFIGMTILI